MAKNGKLEDAKRRVIGILSSMESPNIIEPQDGAGTEVEIYFTGPNLSSKILSISGDKLKHSCE